MRHDQCEACGPAKVVAASGQATHDWKLGLRLGLGMTALLAGAVMALTAVTQLAMADTRPEPSAERQKELVRFVRQECGFCHGLHLTGGLGSPLTAQALAGRPAEALEAAILYGRTGTAMPGWMPFLSESDTRWIVVQLMKGFPQ